MSARAETTSLSSRAMRLRPSATLAVTARVNAMKAAGVDVIGFGAGQPDFDTPQNIKDVAIAAMQQGRTKYVATPGTMEARTAIARKLREENGIACDPLHVVITAGAKHALYMTMQILIEPGDEVLLPVPAWVSYAPMIELAGGQVVELPTSVESAFKITADELEEAITPRTRAILINSPSNPCGTMYSESELREIAAVIERHPDIFIVTDEIYERLIYGEDAHFSIGSLPQVAERTVTINGLSKAYAMTGWRVGYLCAPGLDGEIARRVTMLQDQMTSCISAFSYPAIVEALTNSNDSVETMRSAFAERAAVMFSAIGAIDGLRCPQPTGAFYVFPDVSAHFGRTSPAGLTISSALTFAEGLLEETGVAVVPGEDFGGCGGNHIRLSFACETEAIVEGTTRLRKWLGALR